uniref:Reverse transcriptase n=1 Tax=Cannabis sativa TaxID=3483 RepID=A0A803PDR2_CANSA
MIKRVSMQQEILNTVAAMHMLKAPGPDRMSGCFYRRYWEIVGMEVTQMVQTFFSSGVLEHRRNYTFICLIPKEENACIVDKFRPIFLCNFALKIISKIIATRLRTVIDKLISPFQSAFVPGRWIIESFILTQELVHTIKKKKGKGGLMSIKLDMLKTYDRIEWNFLEEVLRGNRDLLVWREATDGEFTVKRGFETTLLVRPRPDSSFWKLVWRQKINYRYFFMIWRVVVGCLPTRDRLSFAGEKSCMLCDMKLETALHIFWDCPRARAIWFSSSFPVIGGVGMGNSMKEIIDWVILILPGELTFQFLAFLGCLFEGIWKARNDLLFKGCSADISSVRKYIMGRFSESTSLLDTKLGDKRSAMRGIPSVYRIPNSTNLICLPNASCKKGDAGIAVGMLDKEKNHSLWEADYRSIAIACDALVVVKALDKSRCPPIWDVRPLAMKVIKFCKKFDICNFSHISRVDNFVTDSLAKRARVEGHCNGIIDREGTPVMIPDYLVQ